MGSALKDTGGGYNWQKIVRRVLANTPAICAICGQGPLEGKNNRWSVDHIVSRQDFGNGNADAEWNLQRVHLSCNARKSARRTAALKRAKKQGKTIGENVTHYRSTTVRRQERP